MGSIDISIFKIKINKVFQQNIDDDEKILEYTENNIFQQIANVLEIHEDIINSFEGHANLLETFLEQPDVIKHKNPLEYFIIFIQSSYFKEQINAYLKYTDIC